MADEPSEEQRPRSRSASAAAAAATAAGAIGSAASSLREALPSIGGGARTSFSNPVITRSEDVPEPSALLRVYEAALAADATIPPCDALRAILQEASKNEVPLSALDLHGMTIGKIGARALAAMLQLDSFITFANLESTGLGDEGATAVSDALRTHPSIFRLDLGYNGIASKGVKSLSGLLIDSPSLLCLDLSGNNMYSRLGMLAPASLSCLAPLGKALASPKCKLQLLHLDHADVDPKGLTSLVDGLLTNETVVNLRLGENSLDVKAAHVHAPRPAPPPQPPTSSTPPPPFPTSSPPPSRPPPPSPLPSLAHAPPRRCAGAGAAAPGQSHAHLARFA
jgi:hypothetical protein